jgi:hypothetical protein
MMLRWLSLLLLALTAACDPCAGIGACVEPQVRYTGLVTSLFPDFPARGVRVEFVRTAGVELEDAKIVAVADSLGNFVLEGRTRDEGTVTGELTIYPPSPIRPVTVGGVEMSTARAAGELRRLGTWRVEYPFFAYSGRLFHRNNGAPLGDSTRVEFRRTGGIPIYPDTFVVYADSLGRFPMRPRTTVVGEVTGDVVVHRLPPFQSTVVRGVRLSTFTIPRLDSIIPVPVGVGLPYQALLTWEGTRQPAAGVEVEFRGRPHRPGALRDPHRRVRRRGPEPHAARGRRAGGRPDRPPPRAPRRGRGGEGAAAPHRRGRPADAVPRLLRDPRRPRCLSAPARLPGPTPGRARPGGCSPRRRRCWRRGAPPTWTAPSPRG